MSELIQAYEEPTGDLDQASLDALAARVDAQDAVLRGSRHAAALEGGLSERTSRLFPLLGRRGRARVAGQALSRNPLNPEEIS